jgi:hypothetical protein
MRAPQSDGARSIGAAAVGASKCLNAAHTYKNRALTVIESDGETRIEGLKVTGNFLGEDDA